MRKKFLIAFIFISTTTFSQQETANWYFGVHAGLDFTSGSPVAISSTTLVTNEGCASISDISGSLLFYTDGISVWNKNHQVMPNGVGLLGGSSSTQAALIVPQPGSANFYYIFTTDEFGGSNGFRYSIVDMNLQAGNGDITSKNVLVLNNVTEKLTAVKNANGVDYWVAIHEWGSDAFYVYSLTSTGFQTTPVISYAGIVHSLTVNQNTYGQMKFSSCGDKLALAAGYLDTIQILDFNTTSGVVSNAIALPLYAHVYGMELSGDGHLLYASTYDPSGTLVQFDLAAGNTAAIIASKTILSFTPDIYALQMASDGKIYACRSFSQFLGVISSPLVQGTGCNYIDNGIDLDPNFMGITSALGLPAFVQSDFRSEIFCIANSVDELNSGSTVIAFPNPFENNFVINFSAKNPASEINIYDALGKCIGTFPIAIDQKTFYFGSSLPTGIYFLCVKRDSGTERIKVMKALH
ncbi:MAG: T9SS type A sorting domain-containing protein [Bacteroidia bacterium]